jgi:hypothetical protein
MSGLVDPEAILSRFPDWIAKIHPVTGHASLSTRLERLGSSRKPSGSDASPVFCGANDVSQPNDGSAEKSQLTKEMDRPDASPKNGIISLQVISLVEAERLFNW